LTDLGRLLYGAQNRGQLIAKDFPSFPHRTQRRSRRVRMAPPGLFWSFPHCH
jgi:hypothetical protein